MNFFQEQLAKADRLYEITQRIGFALWQLQELEGAAAQYFVLAVQATKGMGLDAGNALVSKAQNKTFGATIRELQKNNLLPPDVATRFTRLLEERNWLVHRSRSHSRSFIYKDSTTNHLALRLDAMADEAMSLLRIVGELVEQHAKRHGVTQSDIDKATQQILTQWFNADAP